MKFSEKWLRKFVNPPLEVNQLAERITLAGLEVDSISPVAGEFTGVVVGHVLSCERHPDADKLNFCKVDIGVGDCLQIICGAPNVKKDLKVAVATIGAVLPGNFKIKKAKLRGIESCGMICSESELGLSEGRMGILELPADAPVGQDFREYLELNDHCIDIELTPNRGDAASVLGIARDVSALFDVPLNQPVIKEIEVSHHHTIDIEGVEAAACPRYFGCLIEPIDNTRSSPIWLSEVLRRSGLRSINPVVDVSNYVMLELGQPCHVFDAAKLSGTMGVRYARSEESIELLNGDSLKLKPENLLITSNNQPVALAGVMGGAHAEVSAATTTVFIESAYFNPAVIRRSASLHHLYSDASYRYERGTDWQLPERVLHRVVELLLQIVGGEAGPVSRFESTEDLPRIHKVSLTHAKLTDYLGLEIDEQVAASILKRLGFAVTLKEGVFETVVPSYRSDVTLDVDLIEEIGRIYGYSNIPTADIQFDVALTLETELRPLQKLRQQLVVLGFSEVINYSFIDPLNCQKINSLPPMILANPMVTDQSVMRTSLLPGLLNNAAYNIARQQKQLSIFEIGKVYLPHASVVAEKNKLALLMTGDRIAKQWFASSRACDFFDLKGDVNLLYDAFGLKGHWKSAVVDYFHPGQSAQYFLAGNSVAVMGKLHPALQKHFDLKQDCFLLEMDVDVFCRDAREIFSAISKYPSVKRDLAFLVDEAVSIAELDTHIQHSCKGLFKEVVVFDVYRGEGVPAGQKSVAVGLILQNPTQTLDESEITAIIQRVIAGLQREFNITLRA
ncbi:MAG: phenylalanine--tRNA ligase subunit beta [Gammaproteobacteria bacterium RIFCSPHIGHO2_12_FULL_41_15]|nr:MAG: phenylalanine--tRNA ligase subunit beta [Gammaproteobacteria bacterium RIFCSPHIGHO2_12_FULL_41_15]